MGSAVAVAGKLPCWMGKNIHQLGEGLWLVRLSHAYCGDVCRPEQESQELHAEDDPKYGGCDGFIFCYVAERREVGVESDYKGDSEFGGIVDVFLLQDRESGNRTSSVDGLLYFLSTVSTGN